MNRFGATLETLGRGLAILGGAVLVLMILVIIVHGGWPVFLEPVQSRFKLISGLLGNYAIIVEGLCFVGPGLLLAALGDWLKNSN